MTLPKEWQQEADRIIVKHGFHEPLNDLAISTVKPIALDLATAYKQAVEKLFSDRLATHKTNISNAETVNQRRAAMAAIEELNAFLTELQTLKPTSND
jgi:hypothetical protein